MAGPQLGGGVDHLGIPGRDSWIDVARHHAGVIIWLVVFATMQLVAFGVVLGLHPAGLDECEATVSRQAEILMLVVAVVAVVSSAVLAMWRLRGVVLVVAMAIVATSGLGWWLLLSAEQSC